MKKNYIYAVGLGTGHIETSSWAHFILINRRGFATLQDALINIYDIVREHSVNLLSEARRYHQSCIDNGREDSIYSAKYLDSKPEDHIEEILEQIIHGDMQDHGEIWELFAHHGWDTTAPWYDITFLTHIVFVGAAPELVVAAKTKWSEIDDWGSGCISEYVAGMKGAKIFNYRKEKV